MVSKKGGREGGQNSNVGNLGWGETSEMLASREWCRAQQKAKRLPVPVRSPSLKLTQKPSSKHGRPPSREWEKPCSSVGPSVRPSGAAAVELSGLAAAPEGGRRGAGERRPETRREKSRVLNPPIDYARFPRFGIARFLTPPCGVIWEMHVQPIGTRLRLTSPNRWSLSRHLKC